MIELQETLPKQPEITIGFSSLEHIGEQDDHYMLTAIYYKKSTIKYIIYIILLILSFGILYLFQRWFLKLKIFLLFNKCDLNEITHVLVIKTKTSIEISNEELCKISKTSYPFCKVAYSFEYELCNFYIQVETGTLHQLRNSFIYYTQDQILNMNGLTDLSNYYGQNIMDVPMKSIPQLLIDEILTPFNIFQISALILWAYDDYEKYSIMIFIITLIQIYIELRDLRKTLQKIRSLIRFNVDVTVIRNQNTQIIKSIDLIPGDLIYVYSNTKISCDCILIDGHCVMNEAILTGESVPINKISLENNKQLFSQKGNENRMIFCGTTCLQSASKEGDYAKAIVYQTGFQTIKGNLARQILFNKTKTFSFYKDSLKYLFVLGAFGLIQANITILISNSQGVSLSQAIINALEIITIIVPPALPTALGAGISLAINRLEKQQIECIKPDKVNVASKINVMAFDKTGTITELGLDVMGCREIKDNSFEILQNIDSVSDLFHYCLSVCHSLSIINKEVVGDPIDLAMFQQTKSELIDQDTIKHRGIIDEIIKRLEFEPNLQRMSVITKNNFLFCKGSPEQIKKLCSNVPNNYDNMLKKYSSKGYRVLSFGYRNIQQKENLKDMSMIHRRELYEIELTFLGFLLFENRIKKESQPTIQILHQSNIKSIMVTGDNPYTACNIGLQCGILNQSRLFLGSIQEDNIIWNDITPKNAIEDNESHYHEDIQPILSTNDIIKLTCHFQLIMTGDVFEWFQKSYLYINYRQTILLVLNKTYIYARMKPNNKGDLMLMLKQDKLNFIGFCGDGTNDTCALRQADVGLALSEEDASLASPFTSTNFNISSVVTLIKEGRACLVTCVECFKFMTLYSCIQAIAVMQCYFFDTDFTQSQYLYIDLWMILPLAFVMDVTKAHKTLANYRPISNLLSIPVITSIITITLICSIAIITMQIVMEQQSFYVSSTNRVINQDYIEIPNYTNTINFFISGTLTISVGIAYTQGPPFRQPIYQNFLYVIVTIIILIGHAIILYFPTWFDYISLEIDTPLYFKMQILYLNIIFGAAIILFEKFITQYLGKKYAESEINLSI